MNRDDDYDDPQTQRRSDRSVASIASSRGRIDRLSGNASVASQQQQPPQEQQQQQDGRSSPGASGGIGDGRNDPPYSGSAASSINIANGGPEYVDLHELAKGWKAALAWASNPATRHEARKKNDRGNLPLHSAASFRAPVEVIGESVVGDAVVVARVHDFDVGTFVS